jgi:site-specific DNA recombinase
VIEQKKLKAKINNLSEIEQRLEQRQVALRKKVSMNNAAPVSAEMVKGLLASLCAIFGNIIHEKRKQLVHTLIKEITVTEDRKIDQIALRFMDQQLLINEEEHGECEQHLAL